ncbi:MAG: CPBP family intramembrane metalloprotease [Candidatus Riflebacteria bacterium]|nr:CPBP family intramembrane metalloprotease [Candidatus Riflebacteria bacterium]
MSGSTFGPDSNPISCPRAGPPTAPTPGPVRAKAPDLGATLGILLSLCLMKARLMWQNLLAKRSRWSLLVFAVAAGGLALSIGAGSVDFLDLLERVFFLREAVRWLLAMGLVYLVVLVFTSDLIMGHTLNAGQLSTDHAYLASLPVPPLAMLGTRVFERVVTDWPGFLFLWSGFVGIACRGGFAWFPFLVGGLLFVQVQILIVLGVILLSSLLHRMARPATVNNAFSLLGYLSAFAVLLPHVAISSQPREALTWLFFHVDRWMGSVGLLLRPARWLTDCLLDAAAGGGGSEFLAWQGFWLAGVGVGAGLFLAMDRAHWLTWVHPGLARRAAGPARAWLGGLWRKDLQLLRSDFNLLSNSLFMPITIIAVQVAVFRGQFHAFGLTHAMNMLAAAALYFCLFGPLNAVGSEGQAISLLETLPLSPSRLIRHKTLFWSVLAELFFLPAALATGRYLGLGPADQAVLMLWLAALIPGMVWVAISLSAIFPRFEGKVLQQRSSIEAKALAPLALGLALPLKDLSAASGMGALTFLLLALSLHHKAVECLAGRLDPERSLAPRFRAPDAFLAILVVLGLQGFAGNVARALSPEAALSLWPWFFAYLVSMMVLARTTWTYARDRFPAPAAALGFRRCGVSSLLLGLGGAGGLLLLARSYLEHLDASGFGVFAQTADAWQVSVAVAGPEWSLAVAGIALCLVAPMVEELFFRGFVDQAFRDLGWTSLGGVLAGACFFAAQHPPLSMPMTFLLGIVTATLFRRSGSLWPGILLHAAYNAGILAIHASHF